MQNEEMDITWIHLLGIFEDSTYPSPSSQGLGLIPKLSREHSYLVGYSRMRVDLAAQIHEATFAVIQEWLSCISIKYVAGIAFHCRKCFMLWLYDKGQLVWSNLCDSSMHFLNA